MKKNKKGSFIMKHRVVTMTEIDWKVGCFRCSKPLIDRGLFHFTSGFDLRWRLWATLNHFRTGQGRCAANFVSWNQVSDPSCSCGALLQTMSHIVNDCPDTKLPGGLSALHYFGWWKGYCLARYAEHTLRRRRSC